MCDRDKMERQPYVDVSLFPRKRKEKNVLILPSWTATVVLSEACTLRAIISRTVRDLSLLSAFS